MTTNPVPPVPAKATAAEESLVRDIYSASPPPPPEAYTVARETPLSSPPQETVRKRQGDEKDFLGRKKGPIRREGEGWVYAPVSSHISRFMLIVEGQVTRIVVVFKGPGGAGEVAEYAYTFDNQSVAEGIFNELRSSPHPYGMVLYPKVIRAGVPYAPVSI